METPSLICGFFWFFPKKNPSSFGGQKKDTQKLDESETIIAVSPFQNKQMAQISFSDDLTSIFRVIDFFKACAVYSIGMVSLKGRSLNKSVKKTPGPVKTPSVSSNGFEVGFLESDAPAIQILNSLNTGVIVCSHSGEISFANAYASKILKCAQKDITQSRVEKILLPIEDIIESVQGNAQDRTRQEKNIQLKNGEAV